MQPSRTSTTTSRTSTTTSAKTTMENRRKRSSSGEIFSFSSTPSPTQESQDSDFEFGCLTPDSPSQDPSRNSPADHLFFNGRLLPHSFPFPPRQRGTLVLSPDNISRATSRTSSVSSKDSLMSSRSNSTNSRSSSSSSARTSLSSDNSERRFLYYNNKVSCRATMASKMVTAQLYGSTQRWQHLTPVPVLKREASIRQNNGGGGLWIKEGSRSKRQQGNNNNNNINNNNKKVRTSDHHERSKGICRRIVMSFLFACRECHAMEPSTKDHVQKNANIKFYIVMDIQRSQNSNTRNTNYNLTLQVLEAENVYIYQPGNNNEFGMVGELYFYVQLCIREVDDTSNLKFFLEKSELSSSANVYISLGFYLDQHGLSVTHREEIQQRISSFARSISFSSGRDFIPIYIEVEIFVEQLQVQFDDDESSFGTGPAAESAIRALEKFKLRREGDYVQLCAICQEEFMLGTEVTALPCSHIYHGDCIVKWMKTSHFCPLCRFEMPSTCSQA